jgi:transcriptional regulator with XRE-family HTH domain
MNKLKKFRVTAGKTQAEVAKAVGVSQPNYHRWEAGQAAIPEAQLKKLSKALKTTPEALLGRHPPMEALIYNDEHPDLSYYGDVAIHFRGGGKPLVLAISETEYSSLHRALQMDTPFVSVRSLANQTVAIRTKAISDLYFSSEAYDDFGPEHDTYEHAPVQIPDPRDWEIIECLATDDDAGLAEDFAEADVKRVEKMIMITDEQYKQLVTDGHIKPEDLESERAKNQAETELALSLARDIKYQFSTGQQRIVSYVNEENDIFSAFEDLLEGSELFDDALIRFSAEGYHRAIFINKEALDYVSIPTHKFEAGRVEADAEAIDAAAPDADDEPKVVPIKKKDSRRSGGKP